MSKQSDNKEKQGFSKQSPMCKNCIHFTSKTEDVIVEWSKQVFKKTTELRCSLGEFKVGLSTYCNEYKK